MRRVTLLTAIALFLSVMFLIVGLQGSDEKTETGNRQNIKVSSASSASTVEPVRNSGAGTRVRVNGSDPEEEVWNRSLTLTRIWHQKPEGRGWGRGEVWGIVVTAAGGDETQLTAITDGSSWFKLEKAKKSCTDYNCMSDDEKCNWKAMVTTIFADTVFNREFAGPEIHLKMRLMDGKRRISEIINSIDKTIKALDTCKGVFSGKTPIDDCAKAASSAEKAWEMLGNLDYEGAKIDTVAWVSLDNFYSHDDFSCKHAGADPDEPDKKRNWKVLPFLTTKKEAYYELEWFVGRLQMGNKWEGGNKSGKLLPEAGEPTDVHEIAVFEFFQSCGAEMTYRAWMQSPNLRDPDDLKDPAGLDVDSREFRFYINRDDDKFTGEPPCGADNYVYILQYRGVDGLSADSGIYHWDKAGEQWTLSSAKPYGLEIGHTRVGITAPLSAIGGFPDWVSAWMVLLVNGTPVDWVPDDPCATPLRVERTPDLVCPSVRAASFNDDTHILTLNFTEPMQPAITGDVLIPTAPSFTVTPDVTGRTLFVTGVPRFPPGEHDFEVVGTMRDVESNLLDGLARGKCGESYWGRFCVDYDFYPCDVIGDDKEEFAVGEQIYVIGTGFPSSPYYLYLILADGNYDNGTLLVDQSTTGAVQHPGGDITSPYPIGATVRWGYYAVAADVNNNGILDLDAGDMMAGICDYALLTGDPCEDGLPCLTAWWPLDEVEEVQYAAEIIVGNHGIHFGDPTSVAGKVSGAYSFDGMDDYIEIPDDDELDIGLVNDYVNGDFTIDAWIKTTDATGVKIIADKRIEGASVLGWSWFLYNGIPQFQMADGVGSPICSNDPNTSSCTNYSSGGASIADGNWHHLAVTCNRVESDGLKFYVDGAFVGGGNSTIRDGSLENSSPLTIARRSSSASGFFAGSIDELNLFDCALTPEEVEAIFLADSIGKCCNDSTLPECECFLAGGCGRPSDCCIGLTGNVDGDPADMVDLGDLTRLIDYLFISFTPPDCMEEANCDGSVDGIVDLSDLTRLIDYLFISFTPPAPCQ